MTQISVLADAIGARVEIVNAAAGDDAARAAAVTGIDLRAQGIRPGDVFAALPGARAHGASFAGTALERGAVAVLTDKAGRDLVAEATSDPVAVLVHPEPRAADRKSTRLNSSHPSLSRMPSSA